jgi:peptide chain release factor
MITTFQEKWVQITSGKGPAECERAVSLVFDKMKSDVAKMGLRMCLVESTLGQNDESYQSIVFSIKGDKVGAFTQLWQGTIQWICISPYRSLHKRKNWFVGVNVLEVPTTFDEIDPKDLRYSTMRASGAGGQHVNTTDSAVRVTHLPTGTTAFAQEERSQHMNKKLAISRLVAMLKAKDLERRHEKDREKRSLHHHLQRGNPVRTFYGIQFEEKDP